MAKEIAYFAGGGAVVADNRFDPKLTEEVTQYIIEHSDFRQFIKTVKVDTYAVVLPRKWAAGIAVEIPEGAEIPKRVASAELLNAHLPTPVSLPYKYC